MLCYAQQWQLCTRRAPTARDAKAWAEGPGSNDVNVEALKARNALVNQIYVAPSGLRVPRTLTRGDAACGRLPWLSHLTPLA